MQRISFDFMSRRIRQAVREIKSKRILRRKERTIEEIKDIEKRKKWEAQFIPSTQRGSSWLRSFWDGKITDHLSTNSRPQRRRLARMNAFELISQRFPGELRRVRRSMAFDSIRNRKAAA
jgi:hypothetical protein